VFLFLCILPGGLIAGLGAGITEGISGDDPPAWSLVPGVLCYVAGIALWLRAYVWRTGTHGQSWGKRLLGIHVLSSSGLMPIGGGMGILRYLLFGVISGATCYIGGVLDLLWPLWDPRHQSLHDKLVSSVVVRRTG
jgi:uncharacterized RDD family membrane protein YckC